MILDSIPRLFEIFILGGAGLLFTGIVTAGVYDVRAASRRPRINAAVRRLRKPTQPWVTVIIFTQEDAGMIAGCLESLKRCRYTNFDIVIVDNASQDGTQQAIRNHLRRHPLRPSRFYAKKKRVSLPEALRQAYRKSRKGELVVTLGAASRPPQSFLKSAVARFVAEPELDGITINEYMDSPLAVNDLASEVARAVWHIIMKGKGLIGVNYGQTALNGIYRKTVVTSERKISLRFEADMLLPVVKRERQPITSTQARAIVVALAFIASIIMSYSMVAAALLETYIPLLVGWLFVTVGTLAVIWSDESISMMQKVQLTLSATIIYFLTYVAFLQLLFGQIVKKIFRISRTARPRRVLLRQQRAIS
jgi:glycosyltransferase involved in cell wall biosynthesis